MKVPVAPDIHEVQSSFMEVLVPLLLMLLLAIAAQLWGEDSRPTDSDRPTRWWPGTPRD
jgi:hypothetical protein